MLNITFNCGSTYFYTEIRMKHVCTCMWINRSVSTLSYARNHAVHTAHKPIMTTVSRYIIEPRQDVFTCSNVETLECCAVARPSNYMSKCSFRIFFLNKQAPFCTRDPCEMLSFPIDSPTGVRRTHMLHWCRVTASGR